MAEYINRAELSVTPIDITDLPIDKCLMVYLAEDVDSLPTADVIEHSKIDNAIEELEKMKVYDRTRTARLVSLPEVFEILKKNIGE